MIEFRIMLYLSLFLALTISCVQGKVNESPSIESEKSDYFLSSDGDTLVFTSGIRSILHDSKGNYWFGSHQEGVARFDGETFTYFTVENGLSSNQVRTIQEDENGVIWFGTGDGVCSFEAIKINQHQLDLRKRNGPGAQIPAVIKLSDLWFNAKDKAGFYGFDGENLNYQPFYLNIEANSTSNFEVTGFSKTRSDYGWIATYSAVFGYDGEMFKMIDDQFLSFYEGIGGNLHVRSVLEDSKGNVWIGNNGIGVLRYDGNTVINFSQENGLIYPESAGNGSLSPSGTLEHVFAITEDKDGNIWFGDRDTGAWRFNGKKMTNFTIDPELESQMIWQIYQDANGELLFAMANGGVYVFNGTGFDRKC